MSGLARWLRFNAVGAMGMALQLSTLAALNQIIPGHYLATSALALELTLPHNFFWHRRYTWHDSAHHTPMLPQALRFHITNGLTSLIGNLVLMRFLVATAHLPLVMANAVAIGCCSLANFALSHRWTFQTRTAATTITLSLALGLLAHAQATLPDAPSATPVPATKPIYRVSANASYLLRGGTTCAIGASQSSAAALPTTGCGIGISFPPLPIFFEVGVMGPQANRSYLTGYISLDGNFPVAPITWKYLPFVIVGYNRLFETGHALDYGLALATPRWGKDRNDGSSMRVELRDYWTFANPSQHNVVLRVGWMSTVSD